MSEQEFFCPKCHSENIQSYELIYSQNVSNSSHMTTGIGTTFGGNIGAGFATTSGTSVTALGETVAPPALKPTKKDLKKGCLSGVIAFFIAFILFAMTRSETIALLAFFAVTAGAAFLGRKEIKQNEQWNREVYPKLLNEWKHSYMCLKCGHRFALR